MRLAIDATNIGPGGGITGLSYYLREWVKMGTPEEIILWASRPEVLSMVESIGGGIKTQPFMVGQPSPKVFLFSQIMLAKKIAKFNPDVVMTTVRMLHNCKIPQLVHHRNLKWQTYAPFWESFRQDGLMRAIRYHQQKKEYFYALKHAASNAYISEYMSNLATSQYPPSGERNYPVQNGGLQCPFSDEEKLRHINSDRPPVIVAVQSTGPHKQSPLLVHIIDYLKRNDPNVPWKLVVIGTVYQPEKFHALIDELDCKGRIEMTGYLPPVKIYEYFREAFCHVMPSRIEGFGNTPLEAMAMGCPVVASNCTAIPEVVGDAGILVSPDSHEEFARGVMELYHNKPLRMNYVQKGFERITLFSWDKAAKKMYDIFCKISGTK